MHRIAALNLTIAALVLAVIVSTVGCGPEQPADLTPVLASALISQKWSQNELNHFTVSFHSDKVIECGVRNDLWKLVQMTDRNGYSWTAYQLTENGTKGLFSIVLKESGKGHEITLNGPYRFEIASITPGSQPDTRNVQFRWDIDWGKAPANIKPCLPKFELSGRETALFQLFDGDWKFLSYLKPEDAASQATTAALP